MHLMGIYDNNIYQYYGCIVVLMFSFLHTACYNGMWKNM